MARMGCPRVEWKERIWFFEGIGFGKLPPLPLFRHGMKGVKRLLLVAQFLL